MRGREAMEAATRGRRESAPMSADPPGGVGSPRGVRGCSSHRPPLLPQALTWRLATTYPTPSPLHGCSHPSAAHPAALAASWGCLGHLPSLPAQVLRIAAPELGPFPPRHGMQRWLCLQAPGEAAVTGVGSIAWARIPAVCSETPG